jgi:hypothetical protein
MTWLAFGILMYTVIGLFWAVCFQIYVTTIFDLRDREFDAACVVMFWPGVLAGAILVGGALAFGFIMRTLGKGVCAAGEWLRNLCKRAE